MKDDTVVALRQPESFSDDPLTEILRAGARQLLGQAIEAEVAAHIEAHADLTDASGRRRIVRHGHMPEREVQTGIGAVTVKRPRVRDRDPQATGGRIRFTSSILPPYLRRAKSVEALLPWLYLKGISSGDFSEPLAALLGPDAPGLTASTIGRLKAVWWDEYEAWQKRDLSARRYVYFWADGVYFSPRMDHDKQCVLVIIGADAMGNKDMRWIVGGKAIERQAASTSQMGRFETELLATDENVEALVDMNGVWIDKVHDRHPPKMIILDMDSSVSPTHGEQEGTAYQWSLRLYLLPSAIPVQPVRRLGEMFPAPR